MYFAVTMRSHHLQRRKPDFRVLLWLLCLLPPIRQWCGAAYQLLHCYHIWLGCGISCNSQGMAFESTIPVLPLSCFLCTFKYSYLQMYWCVNLLGIPVCWAEKPLLCYWCMASCRFMGRYYELFQSAMMLMLPSIFDCLKKSLFLLHFWTIVVVVVQ